MLIIRRSKLYYTASGIITPVGCLPVHRLREESSLNVCKGLLEILKLTQLIKKLATFYGTPEGLLRCSQNPATCIHLEPPSSNLQSRLNKITPRSPSLKKKKLFGTFYFNWHFFFPQENFAHLRICLEGNTVTTFRHRMYLSI